MANENKKIVGLTFTEEEASNWNEMSFENQLKFLNEKFPQETKIYEFDLKDYEFNYTRTRLSIGLEMFMED